MTRQKGGGQEGAGSPKIYAEETQRAPWVMPVSVAEGLKDYLDTYKEEIRKLRKEKRFRWISDIEELENDCWAWIEKKIKGTYKFLSNPVSAGGTRTSFDDIPPDEINLEDLISAKPETSYFVKVTGESMIDLGISDSDILKVETFSGHWTNIKNGTIVIATYNDELMVKIFHRERRDKVVLYSANREDSDNPAYGKREIDMVEEQSNLKFQGIVKQAIKSISMANEKEYLS